MNEDEEQEALHRWAFIMNKGHGYGGVFNYNTDAEKKIVEVDTAQEWRRAVELQYRCAISAIEVGADPPDCLFCIDHELWGLELVQLTEPEHRRRASAGESPYKDKLFIDMQWDQSRLVGRINDLISKKGEKYRGVELVVQVLLIHAAEPFLTSIQARQWLTDHPIVPHPNISSAFLLFSYEPHEPDAWPLLLLYGEFPPHR